MTKLSTMGLYPSRHTAGTSQLGHSRSALPMLLLGLGLLFWLLCLDTSNSQVSWQDQASCSTSRLASPQVTSASSHTGLWLTLQSWHHELQGAGCQLPRHSE